MTEICCYNGNGPLFGFGPQYDPTMTSGLWLADTIWADLSVAGDSAFDWWTALSSALGCDPSGDPTCTTTLNHSGWNDGLLYYDPRFATDGNHSIYKTKRYWVMGNFSRYVRPGALRHEILGAPQGVRALAFSKSNSWTVIVIDDQAQGSAPVRLNLSIPSSSVGPTGAWRTSATTHLSRVREARSNDSGGFDLTVPAQSVTTYTFKASSGP